MILNLKFSIFKHNSMVLTQPPSTMQQQQQQHQQFEQHQQQQQQPSSQVESKFRIIKTDSNASRSTDNPSEQTDSSSSSAHQQVEDANDAHLPHSHQQAASLNIIGNYQRRGRWLVKDFSPDQLVQGMKTTGVPPVQHHQTVDEAYMNAHLHQANANQTRMMIFLIDKFLK
jgi:hypothetical protein